MVYQGEESRFEVPDSWILRFAQNDSRQEKAYKVCGK